MFYSFHFQSNDLANKHPRYSSMHWNKSSFIVKNVKETQVYDLTLWGRVTHICVSKLSILGSDKSHYLKQCWIMINWTLRNKLQWHFNTNSNIFIKENPFQKVVWKITSILSRPQCINGNVWWHHNMKTISPLPTFDNRWPVNSPHKDLQFGAFMISLLLSWTSCGTNNRFAVIRTPQHSSDTIVV